MCARRRQLRENLDASNASAQRPLDRLGERCGIERIDALRDERFRFHAVT
jgi:hypothetical protein